jgi:hypothetical protein
VNAVRILPSESYQENEMRVEPTRTNSRFSIGPAQTTSSVKAVRAPLFAALRRLEPVGSLSKSSTNATQPSMPAPPVAGSCRS